MTFAPIILFVYNRPANTQRTLDELAKNEEAKFSTLYIYCDGPKENSDALQLSKINAVRKICASENRFKEVKIIDRKKNLGLATSIISGVTDVINRHGDIIVLEDDIRTSRYFLKFMNDALQVYKNDEKVISVGGCNYFVLGKNKPATFFIPIPDCLGWVIWLDRWKLFETDSKKLLNSIIENKLQEKFNLYGFYNFSGMLKDQSEGKVSSWAIRWQAVAYLNNKITIYPNPSVTQHLESKDATHAIGVNITPPLLLEPLDIIKEELNVKTSSYYFMLKAYYTYFDKKPFEKFKKMMRFLVFWIKNKSRIIEENKLV